MRVGIDIWEEDMEILKDEDIKIPNDIGALCQRLIDIYLTNKEEYYQEIIEYLLDALEEEHMDSRAIYTKQLKKEFNYELKY